MRKSMVWVCLLVALLSMGAFAAVAQAGTVANGDMQDVTFGLPGPKAGRFTIDDAGKLSIIIDPPTNCVPGETINLVGLCDLVSAFDITPDPVLNAGGGVTAQIPGAFPPDAADICPVPVVLGFGLTSGCFLVNGH